MGYVIAVTLALVVGWKLRGAHERVLRFREEHAELFGPVSEPTSNVIPIRSSDGDGLIA